MGLREIVDTVLAEDEWPLFEADDHTRAATVEGENGAWLSVVQVFEESGVFAFYSVVPVEVSDGTRAAVTELVTRANSGLVTGNFEHDLRDDEVRFKTALDVSAVPADKLHAGGIVAALVRDLIADNITAVDRYLPAFAAVADGAPAADAVAAVEAAVLDLSAD